jgi:hypothetical protein
METDYTMQGLPRETPGVAEIEKEEEDTLDDHADAVPEGKGLPKEGDNDTNPDGDVDDVEEAVDHEGPAKA